MKRHTYGHGTGMTFQAHMNNCGQQPERNKTEITRASWKRWYYIHNEIESKVVAVTHLIWR
jgi:hypothetical protein